MMRFNSVFVIFVFITSTFSAFSKNITVAQDGSGDFKTVQEAFNSVPLNNTQPITILIKNGIYKEKLVLDSTKNHVTIIGENVEKTVLTYDDFSGKILADGTKLGTTTSTSTRIVGNDFTAINITFANSWGTSGQAVAMLVDGDRVRVYRLPLSGFSRYSLS